MKNKTLLIAIIYCPDLKEDKIYVVSSDKESLSLPQLDLTTINPEETNIEMYAMLESVFSKYTDVSFTWCRPKFLNVDITHENDTITTAIYYGIYLPINTPIKNSNWIDITSYIGFYPTLRKLICML